MIPISEVLEEAAQTVEGFDACDPKHMAEAIRAHFRREFGRGIASRYFN